jgi:hypothetical protein
MATVNTIYGEMDTSKLAKFEYYDPRTRSWITDYYTLDEKKELVHRSSVVGLEGVQAQATAKL